MLLQKLVILCYILIVKGGNSKIKQDIKKKGKVEYCEIKTILFCSHSVLDCTVDTKDPEGFDQQI